MDTENVNLSIPIESLLDSITHLQLKDKLAVWKSLNEQLASIEDEYDEQDPTIQADIREARVAYQAGDYVTLDEYIAKRDKSST